jgi:hypothetical protein
MASKRRLKRKACTGKIKYAKVSAAIAASRALYKKTGAYVQAYKCKYCSSYHVGHWRGGTKW